MPPLLLRRPGVLTGVMLLVTTVYVAGLLRDDGGAGVDVLVDRVLGTVAALVPGCVVLARVRRAALARTAVVLSGLALLAFGVGNAYYLLSLTRGTALPFPSWADAGYVLFLPLMVAALVVVTRAATPGPSSGRGRRDTLAWLDGDVASLGAAAVVTCALGPVLDAWLREGPTPASLVALTYPVGDVVLLGLVARLATLEVGGRGLHPWPLAAGVAVFAGTDLVYTRQVADGTYAVGTVLDAGWVVGLVLVAVWVDGLSGRSDVLAQVAADTAPEERRPVEAVPAAATLASLAVLVAAARAPLPVPAVVLAALCVVVASARTQVLVARLRVAAAERRREALTDLLTGLPNRQGLAAAARGPVDGRAALLLLDLDDFTDVNDGLGHAAGDAVLVQVGERLRSALPGTVVARQGSDEFAALLPEADDEAVGLAVDRVRLVLRTPVVLEGTAVHLGASIGVATAATAGPRLDDLMRAADVALARAKGRPDGVHVHDATDAAEQGRGLRLLDELRVALARDELVVHHQPKVDLTTGTVTGVEALVRWQHPERGLVPPGDFLPVAERGGLMGPLTGRVLDLALREATGWWRDGLHLPVAVNLPAHALFDPDLPARLVADLAARGLPPAALRLELTEDLLVQHRERAADVLGRLREAGVQVAIDDFGTGYSSLAYLRDLPVDELKLDRSFTARLTDDRATAAIVASTVRLGHELGLRIVAEGVETQEAYDRLAALGCDQAQGYLVARPLPGPELRDWLRHRDVAAAAQRRHVAAAVARQALPPRPDAVVGVRP
ncbi:putative bifunctional diguanylate cyclase/phosphodiesterase [Cellulomonas endophytica]|uniref:putative bifunctional diguanylate cyclase/phosphodiesterase n=1 Tax=Cellulomonas endophytica TaxID=2494735 RepID=UPI001013944A|nr:bifunctional diguanylate cyclase/phosphodiesterase [Cellulomonas endophytica]